MGEIDSRELVDCLRRLGARGNKTGASAYCVLNFPDERCSGEIHWILKITFKERSAAKVENLGTSCDNCNKVPLRLEDLKSLAAVGRMTNSLWQFVLMRQEGERRDAVVRHNEVWFARRFS